jgi:hypothetical protein
MCRQCEGGFTRFALTAFLAALVSVAVVNAAEPAPASRPAFAPAAVSADGLLDGCRFAGDDQARAAWTACGGSDPVRLIEMEGRQVVRVPCNFKDRADLTQQAWQRAVELDLSGRPGIEIELFCPDPAAVLPMRICLGGANGGASRTLGPGDLATGWNTIQVRKAQTEPQTRDAAPDWAHIRAIRFEVTPPSRVDTMFCLSEVRVLGEDPMVRLTRLPEADRVELKDGTVVTGSVLNKSYTLTTPVGRATFPAERVEAVLAREGAQIAVVLTDGQVFSGIAADAEVRLAPSPGDPQSFNIRDVRQCAYRVCADRPEHAPPAAPTLTFGDCRAAYRGEKLKLSLQSGAGRIDLPNQAMVKIEAAEGEDTHRVTFRDGSALTGTLGPETLRVALETDGGLNLPTRHISRFDWPERVETPVDAAAVVLRNGDKLFGKVANESLTIKADFGPVPLRPGDILSMELNPVDVGMATAHLWGDSTIRGRLMEKTISFTLAAGPALQVKTADIVSITMPQPRRAGK